MNPTLTRALAFARTRRRDAIPVQPQPPDEHALAMLDRARALGAPDPYLLLDLAEASRLAGVPLGPPEPLFSDTVIGVRASARAAAGRRWLAEVHVVHGEEPGADLLPTWPDAFVLDAAAEHAVAGQPAVQRHDGTVAVFTGAHIVLAQLCTPEPTHDAGRSLHLARLAIERLPGER